VLATAQTGTGNKTLAFLIPVIEKHARKDKELGKSRRWCWVQSASGNAGVRCNSQRLLRGKQLVPAAWLSSGLSEGRKLRAIARERGWW